MTMAVRREVVARAEQSDADRDAMHILPLAILPVKHPALLRTRLVKNCRLESMVEMFAMDGAGAGHMTVTAAARALGLGEAPADPDLTLLRKISHLPSFDVYSLRVLLRDCDISIADDSALSLSRDKMESLNGYMAAFTRPLVREVFGDQTSIGGLADLVGMMRDCSAETVRARLGAMSDKLGIEMGAIPRFLEDYADIFLSLSYYRQCLDEILPPMEDFMRTVRDLRGSYQMKQDVNLLHTLDLVEETINALTANVTGRLESFERATGDMWRDLTAERFTRIQTMVRGCHTHIGGVLCALSVKLHAWQRLFPRSSSAGPMRRAEFILSEMRQGIDTIRALENAAPVLSQLQS